MGDPENPQEPFVKSEPWEEATEAEAAKGSKMSEETEEVYATRVASEASSDQRHEPTGVFNLRSQEERQEGTPPEERSETDPPSEDFLPKKLEDQKPRRLDHCGFLCCQAGGASGWLLPCARPEVAEEPDFRAGTFGEEDP